MKKFFLWGALVFILANPLNSVQAAQSGKIIVDSATVREFPQIESKMLDHVAKDTVIAVSNLPTEGFYKVRTSGGMIGWISGNEIYVAGGNTNISNPPANQPEIPAAHPKHKRKKSYQDSSDEEESDEPKPFKDDIRFIVMGGLHNLNYGDLFSKFGSNGPGTNNSNYFNYGLASGDLNYGESFIFEAQKRWTSTVHLALRVEVYTAKSGTKSYVGTLGGNYGPTPTSPSPTPVPSTIIVSNTVVPVMVGLNWSPIDSQKFRLGFGAYAGATIIAATTIQTSLLIQPVKYSSLDPCATLVMQGSYGIFRHMGIAYEVGYHYDLPGTTPVSANYGTGFKINYSGEFVHLGLELRF